MHENSDELCGIEALRSDWIESLKRNLCRRISLRELYLFGSRASGEHLTWSDYDVCVVSEDFRSLSPWERMELVVSCWEGARAIEPVCFTPEEFARDNFTLIQEIRKKGILLYPSADDADVV